MTPVATYPGDVSISILGEIKGPTTIPGHFLTAVSATLVVDDGPLRTEVEFRDGVRCMTCLDLIPIEQIGLERLARAIHYCLPLRHEGCPPPHAPEEPA